MKKSRRLTLDELSKVMDVISKEEQKLFYGGYDENDCVWRCLAYIYSQGENYSQEDAMEIAKKYWGDEFEEDNYAFSGTMYDLKYFVQSNPLEYTGKYPMQMMVFDPNDVPGMENTYGYKHAVVITEFTDDYYYYFDPQSGESGRILRSYLVGKYGSIINVKNYGTYQ